MKKGILLLLAVCVWRWAGDSPAVWAAAGKEGANFLNIPVGAGPAALASAYTALATDAYAPVYNPAGLGFLNSTQVAAQHLSYLATEHDEFFSAVHPLRAGSALGASIQYLGSGDITQTDINGNSIGHFSASFASYNLAYGRAIGEKWSVGGTVKWIHARLSDVSAGTGAGDVGVLYHPLPRWTLASTLMNIGRTLNFLGDGDNLPLGWHIGTAYQTAWPLSFAGEVVYRRSGPASTHVGVEWQVLPAVAWRAGYRTDTVSAQSQLAGFTTGVGIKLGPHEFSYAWVPLGELGNTQYFSLLLRFGEGATSGRNLIRYETIKRRGRSPARSSKDWSGTDQLMDLLKDEPVPPRDKPKQ